MPESAPGRAPGRPFRRAGRFRGGRRSALGALLRTGLVGTCVVTAYYLLPMAGPTTVRTAALLVGGLLAVLLVFAWEVRTIMRSPYPRLRAVEALVATLALFLVVFASAYHLLEYSSPGSFSEPLTRTDALYFALTTLATVGYGDIVARSQAGRAVAMLQMTGGLLFAGVAVRILTEAIRKGLRQQPDRRAAGAGRHGGSEPEDRP